MQYAPDNNRRTVILLGASTRAAAVSAARAGLTPWCADLFADADLSRIATVQKIPTDAYPKGLLEAFNDAPAVPVIYTGALENHPHVIDKIDLPVWGNSPNVLRVVRSPEHWSQALRSQGIECPDISGYPRSEGNWLLKPRKSAAGVGIRDYRFEQFNPRTHFLQQRVDGSPCSAIFVSQKNHTIFVGASRQLIGPAWLNAGGYQYAGNIAPIPLDPLAIERWQLIGSSLANAFGLRGLFGVDAILCKGIPWPLEVNPRYTASVELFERSYRHPLLPLHTAVFEEIPMPMFTMPRLSTVWGKAILFARQTFAFPTNGPWMSALADEVDLDSVEYADIPHAGEIIEEGQPVFTIFATAETVADCEMKLKEKARDLDRRLWG